MTFACTTRLHIALLVLLLLTAISACRASDWPQFQGPSRDGIAVERGLAHAWPADGPKALWAVPLAESYGGAAVRDGQVFILERMGEGVRGKDTLHCLALADGRELWHFTYPAPGEFDLVGARCTPAVDARHVYSISPTGLVLCLDRTTHQPVWRMNLITDFSGEIPRWGVAQSPLLYGDWLIVAPQSKTAGVAALDKDTGKVVWRSAPIGIMAYASPILATIDGVPQVVMLTQGKTYEGNNTVAGINLADGTVLWQYTDWRTLIPIPCPTPLGNGRFFLTGGNGTKGTIFKVAHQGDQWNATTEIAGIPGESNLQNALCYQDHLYVNSANNGKGLLCLDLQGHLCWQHNTTPPLEQGGNLLIADGLIIYEHGRTGELFLAEANPTAYTELAHAKLLAPANNWAPMALVDGKLLVRDKGMLRCFSMK